MPDDHQSSDPTDDDIPRYPADHAFVVQFEHAKGGDRFPGRVEHLASGHASRFQSSAQMMKFVTSILAAMERNASQPAAPSPPEEN